MNAAGRVMALWTLAAACIGDAHPASDPKPGEPPTLGPAPEKESPRPAPLESLENRPHRSLSAIASNRRDYLTGRELWSLKPNLTLHKLLDLPSWASVTLEERFRFEDYAVPWIKGTSKGQWSTPLQSVLFTEIRATENIRLTTEFWDARQWGPTHPNRIDSSMVNTLNFTQLYGAGIFRNVFDQKIDMEIKAGEMTLSLGSTRLIGRYAFRNTQQPFVGLQTRLYDPVHHFELCGFVQNPMQLLPNNTQGLLENQMVWNRPSDHTIFSGLFFKTPLTEVDRFETYFYALTKNPSQRGIREYLTPGLRIYRDSRPDRFDYEIESIGEAGHASMTPGKAPTPASAIMEHVQIGYAFNIPWHPRLVAEWDYASPSFNPLFGIAVIDFGPTGVLGLFDRVNINSPGWRWQISPTPDIFFFMSHRFWWLADGSSPVGWNTSGLSDPTGRAGSYVGETLEVSARWDASYNFAIQAGWQMLMKGRFAKEAPGAPLNASDVNYFYLETEVRI